MHDLHGWAPQATQVSNQWRQDGHLLLIAGAKVSAGLRTGWELGAGSVKLGCLAQIPASWGPSVMGSIYRYWPFVRGIYRSPLNSLHKDQRRRALMFSLICAWISGWVNNGEAGDLRRHCTHYDVIVMPCAPWRWGNLIALPLDDPFNIVDFSFTEEYMASTCLRIFHTVRKTTLYQTIDQVVGIYVQLALRWGSRAIARRFPENLSLVPLPAALPSCYETCIINQTGKPVPRKPDLAEVNFRIWNQVIVNRLTATSSKITQISDFMMESVGKLSMNLMSTVLTDPTPDVTIYKYRLKRKEKNKSREEIFDQMKVFFLLRSVVGSVFCKSATEVPIINWACFVHHQ